MQTGGGGRQIVLLRFDNVQGLGQQRCKVVVVGVDSKRAALATQFPARRRDGIGRGADDEPLMPV